MDANLDRGGSLHHVFDNPGVSICPLGVKASLSKA